MTDRQKHARLREIFADPKAPSLRELPILYLREWRRIARYRTVHLSGNAIHKSFCLPDRDLLAVAKRVGRLAGKTFRLDGQI